MNDLLPLRALSDPLADPTGLLLVDARRLAAMLCAGVRTVRTWNTAGKLPAPIRIGGRVLWRVSEIRAWIAAGAPDRETWTAIRAAQK